MSLRDRVNAFRFAGALSKTIVGLKVQVDNRSSEIEGLKAIVAEYRKRFGALTYVAPKPRGVVVTRAIVTKDGAMSEALDEYLDGDDWKRTQHTLPYQFFAGGQSYPVTYSLKGEGLIVLDVNQRQIAEYEAGTFIRVETGSPKDIKETVAGA